MIFATVLLLSMLLEVLICASIFDELSCTWQYIRISIERDRLNDISGEQVHQGLDIVHLIGHLLRYRVLHAETL